MWIDVHTNGYRVGIVRILFAGMSGVKRIHFVPRCRCLNRTFAFQRLIIKSPLISPTYRTSRVT